MPRHKRACLPSRASGVSLEILVRFTYFSVKGNTNGGGSAVFGGRGELAGRGRRRNPAELARMRVASRMLNINTYYWCSFYAPSAPNRYRSFPPPPRAYLPVSLLLCPCTTGVAGVPLDEVGGWNVRLGLLVRFSFPPRA